MVNYSRIIGEVMVLMKKPSVSESPSGRAPERAPDGILRRQKLAAAEKYFRWSPDFFWNLWDYIGERPRSGDVQGAHKPGWRGPPGRGVGDCGGPSGSSGLAQKSSDLLPFQKKIFSGIFFRLDSVSKSPLKGVKNMEKNRNWHLALS